MSNKLDTQIKALRDAITAFSSKQDSHNSRMFEKLDYESNYNHSQLNKFKSVIESQQRTIELLTGALQEKYKDGLFILSDEHKPLVIIKNGQNIINKRTTYCRVSWTPTSSATIEIEEAV